MDIKNIIFIITLTLITNPSYGEIYKWKDKEGRIHYSENKPENHPEAKENSISIIETNAINTQPTRLKYVAKRNHYYCGEEKIHSLSSEKQLLQYAHNNINTYKKSLAKKEELLKEYQTDKKHVKNIKYLSGNQLNNRIEETKNRKTRLQNEILILECKIDWAETIINKIEDLNANAYDKLKNAQKELETAIISRNDACGYNSPIRSSYTDMDKFKLDSEAYRDCYNKHTEIVNQKREDVNYLENSLQRLNQEKAYNAKTRTY